MCFIFARFRPMIREALMERVRRKEAKRKSIKNRREFIRPKTELYEIAAN